jgi:hypothetical protein
LKAKVVRPTQERELAINFAVARAGFLPRYDEGLHVSRRDVLRELVAEEGREILVDPMLYVAKRLFAVSPVVVE